MGSEQVPAVDAALDWLVTAQSPSGEMPSWASPLDEGDHIWVADSLQFITALAALALDRVDDPRAQAVVDGAVTFLRFEREVGSQWRYWSRANDQHEFTPPDADDTACCSMAVACRGVRTDSNVRLLLANQDPEGRFYTWLIPHRPIRNPRTRFAWRDEWRSEVRSRRQELWDTTEAEPDDIDAVVNANVCRYLGPRHAPRAAVEWVASVLEAGNEGTADKWHRNPATMYAAVADGARRGIGRFAALAAPVAERIEARTDEQGDPANGLDTALSLLALQAFATAVDLRRRLARHLIATQAPDGSWARSVFYYGGPREVFGWASEAMTTAHATQALAAEVDL